VAIALTPGASPSAVMREHALANWANAVEHPMVDEIRRGTLPAEVFRRYFEQNLQYLEDYTRAIAACLSISPDRETMVILTDILGQIVETEIPANEDFLRRCGGDPARTYPPTAATSGYAGHLLECARTGDIVIGLTALLPCQWSYGDLAVLPSAPQQQIYADWLAIFSDDSYHEMMAVTAGLIDRLVLESGRAELDDLVSAFRVSAEWEVRFWDTAYYGPGGASIPPVPS
jgi:thiaminase